MARVRLQIGSIVLGVCCMLLVAEPVAEAEFHPTTCNNAFTPQQEIAEGQKAAAQVYQTMPVLPDSDPVVQYVQQIGAKLVAHAPIMPGVGRQWPFNYHVVANADVNAFALPGGTVFINLGTIQAAQTEAQLAGVMAHETSHVVMRHSTCNITAQKHKSIVYGIGSIASAILLGNGAAGALAQGAIGLGENLDFLHMSRGDEQQADLLGTDILYDAGYDPRGLPQFFEIIQAKYGAGGAQMLSDHPNPGNRTGYVNAEIATLPPKAHYVVTTPEFTRIHALAMQEKTFTAAQIKSGVWKQGNRYESGPGGSVSQVSAPINQGVPPAGAGGTEARGGALQALNRTQLGVGEKMVRVQGSQFVVSRPANWQQSADANGGVTLSPPGGADSSGIAYGVLINAAKLDGGGVTDAASLTAATNALVQRLVQQNSGLVQAGQPADITVNGRPGESVDLRGQSPVVQRGSALVEHDWLVTVERADGDLNYLVFVAPEQDFETARSTFHQILQSFQAQ